MSRLIFFLIATLLFCAPLSMIGMLGYSILAGDIARLSLETDLLLIGLWASGTLLIAALAATYALDNARGSSRRR